MGSRDHFRTRGYSVGPTTLSHPNLKLLGFRVNPDAQIAVGTKHQTAAGANSLRTLGVGSGLQVWPLASNPRHSQSAKKGPQAGGNCLRTLGVGSGLQGWSLDYNPHASSLVAWVAQPRVPQITPRNGPEGPEAKKFQK